MTDTEKKTLSAKKILSDIRSGMDDSGLKLKYDLSDKALDTVCRRLVAAGALTEQEIRRLKRLRGSPEPPPQIPEAIQWRCPACNVPQAAEMPECPACGIVVAKFTGRQERERRTSAIASKGLRDAGPRDRTGWTPVVLSVLVFAAVGGALLVWSTHKAKEPPKISTPDQVAQSFEEVGTEAEPPAEPSGATENESKDYTELEVEASQETMAPPAPVVAIPQETPDRMVAVPREKAPPPTPPRSEQPEYVTGVLRQFSSGNFKKEVVEASKTYPVLFQFYSET